MSSSTSIAERPCALLVHNGSSELPNAQQLRKQLEDGSDDTKIDALKKVITLLINGESLPQLLMPIIRFVLPSKDRTIKKLLLLYWEVVDKRSADGKTLQEMILVCNALMRDLNHPNEYIRGSTLRLLCKLKEPELLEPLIESVRQCLEHRHSYVRRNAVLAVYSIYRDLPHLMPDAPDLIYNFLQQEGDASCKRNAFLMLFNVATPLAMQYLTSVMDSIASFGEMQQLIVLEMIRRVSRSQPAKRLQYMRIIFTLLASAASATGSGGASSSGSRSQSAAVQYEAAVTLLTLSRAPTAARAAAHALISLLQHASDNNIKLIVLDKIHTEIKTKHPKILQELIMDVLRAVASPNLDIVRKTLEIALDAVTPANIHEVVSLLKKEITRSQSEEIDRGGEYRQLLIQAIHTCAVRFPDVAADVVHQLVDFLGDSNVNSALDVVVFVREVLETYPDLRVSVLEKIFSNLHLITSAAVYRPVLWIIGEYAETSQQLQDAFSSLLAEIGTGLSSIPASSAAGTATTHPDGLELLRTGSRLLHFSASNASAEEAAAAQPTAAASSSGAAGAGAAASRRPVVLADGTYASSSALSLGSASANVSADGKPSSAHANRLASSLPKSPLVTIFIGGAGAGTTGGAAGASQSGSSLSAATASAANGGAGAAAAGAPDLFLASALASTVTKLVLRARKLQIPEVTRMAGCAALLLVTILRVHETRSGTSDGPAAAAASTLASSVSAVDPDSKDWIVTCLRVLTNPTALLEEIFLRECRKAFTTTLHGQRVSRPATSGDGAAFSAPSSSFAHFASDQHLQQQQPDDLIRIRQLRPRPPGASLLTAVDMDDEEEQLAGSGYQDTEGGASVLFGSGSADAAAPSSPSVTSPSLSSRLSRIVQLTGLSDSLYAEAVIYVHQYDIVLDMTVMNQTSDTLQNLSLELATLGDLKLVERPQSYNVGPHGTLNIKANIKISSTETGTVFGTIVYDIAGASAAENKVVVVLNEIHIDIIDYIAPAACEDPAFRSMWQEFEWENRVLVNTSETSLQAFLEHLLAATNMRCLAHPQALDVLQQCGFYAVNLYAKSKFGEDALANLSIQRIPSGKLSGYVRIRSKTQGIAISLGEKITQKMK